MADRGGARLPDRAGALRIALGVGLRGERDHVGELRDGREIAQLGKPGEAERVQAVAGQQRQVGVVRAHDASGAVVLEVALDDRLHEQRVVLLAAGRARAGRRGGAELGREAVGVGERGGEKAAVLAERRRERGQRGHLISSKAAAAASSVRVTCSGVCASEGNQASNCDGGG